MGTHPIFESDFDCLTDKNLDKLGHALRTVFRSIEDLCHSIPMLRESSIGPRIEIGRGVWPQKQAKSLESQIGRRQSTKSCPYSFDIGGKRPKTSFRRLCSPPSIGPNRCSRRGQNEARLRPRFEN